MNRKIILLPLVSLLFLASCGGDETSSSTGGLSVPDSSSQSGPVIPEYTHISDILALENEMTYQNAQAVYMGHSPLNEEYNNYDYTYVADGDSWYLLYRVGADVLPENLVPGESIVKWSGKVANYAGEGNYVTTESTVTSMEVVDGDYITAEWNTLADGTTFAEADMHKGYAIENAFVTDIEKDNYGTYDITVKTSESATSEYLLHLDNRYCDVKDEALTELQVGDSLSLKAFVSFYNKEPQFIVGRDFVRTPGEGYEEPEVELTKLSEAMKTPKGTDVKTRGVYMGMSDLARDGNRHNYMWIADGETAATLYTVQNTMTEGLDLVAGETVIEIAGTRDTYNGLEQIKSLKSMTIVEDDTVKPATAKEITGQDLTAADVGHQFTFTDAVVSGVSADDKGNVSFTATEDEKGYAFRWDSRDVAAEKLAIKDGDKISGTSFLCWSNGAQFVTAAGLSINGESGEDPEPVEPVELPDPVEISIADIIGGKAEEGTLYEVTGILEASENDEFGNAYLTDPETKSTVMVYGNTTTATALSTTDGTTVEYSNPKDAQTTLADIKDGDKITVHCVYEAYVPSWNPSAAPTHEIMCVTVAHETPADATYAIAIDEAIANGQVTAAATAAYGADVVLTLTPDEGYAIGEVTVDHGYGTETIAPVDGAYSFKATAINNVSATFVETVEGDLVDVTYDLTKVETKSTNAYDATGLKGHFDASLTSETNIIQSVTATDKVYPGNSSGGPGAMTGLKFGSGSADGYVTILFAADVTSVTITAHAWSDGKIATIGAYDTDDTLLDSADVSTKAATTVTLEFAATRTLTIKVTEPSGGERRCVMTSMVFNKTVEA